MGVTFGFDSRMRPAYAGMKEDSPAAKGHSRRFPAYAGMKDRGSRSPCSPAYAGMKERQIRNVQNKIRVPRVMRG